jgi:hypothetical protein
MGDVAGQPRGVDGQPSGQVHRLLGAAARGARIVRERPAGVVRDGALPEQHGALGGVDDVDVALVDRDDLPGEARARGGLEHHQLGVAAVGEGRGPRGPGGRGPHLGRRVAEHVRDGGLAGLGGGQLGGAGRGGQGRQRRAVDLDQPAVLGDVRLEAVAEHRYAVHRLDEAEVVGARHVDVVLAQRQAVDRGGVQPEDVGVGLDVVQGDRGRLPAAGAGQETVGAGDPARCAGGLVDVDDALHAERFAQLARRGAGPGGDGRPLGGGARRRRGQRRPGVVVGEFPGGRAGDLTGGSTGCGCGARLRGQ